MTNLATVNFNTNGEYKKLSEISGVSFTAGNTYVLQVLNPCVLCESAETPASGGFYISSPQPLQYKAGNGDLYVKTEKGYPAGCVINIAE